MMNFSMNYRKRAPMGIIQVAQVIDNVRSMPLQVARVPVVKAVVKDVESHISKPIKKELENLEKKFTKFEIVLKIEKDFKIVPITLAKHFDF